MKKVLSILMMAMLCTCFTALAAYMPSTTAHADSDTIIAEQTLPTYYNGAIHFGKMHRLSVRKIVNREEYAEYYYSTDELMTRTGFDSFTAIEMYKSIPQKYVVEFEEKEGYIIVRLRR